MTDSTAESLPADFAGILEARAQAEMADRQRNIRRTIAGVAVLIVHVIALAIFIYSGRIPMLALIKATVPEPILWIMLPHPNPPPKKIETPQPEETLPLLTAPITLPPIENRPIARPPSGGLLGVGRSLACGASSYEYLSPAQREQCLRHPWHFVRRPDGTIVLEAPPKPVEAPLNTGDIIRHEQQTAPPCPILSNVPCLGKIMHGDPLGGGPLPF